MGDFHLSFSDEKPMDVFGKVWENHNKKIEENCRTIIKQEDVLVIPGDHSWGMNLTECMPDLEFIAALPGKKILLRGNHDLFWPSSKTASLNKRFEGKLSFLQNNYYSYRNYALVGMKGCIYDGNDTKEHFLKIQNREMQRLELSLRKASEDGFEEFIVFGCKQV